MKTRKYIYSAIAALFSFVLVYTSCSNISINENSVLNKTSAVKEKATVMIAFEGDFRRTALPSLNWDDFTYTLTAVQNPGEATQKDPVTLFTDRTKEQLVQGVAVDLGKFKFTLTAKKDGTPALSGVTTADLSQNTTLTFRMMAVAGGKGSATVKIVFPKDGAVTTVKAGYATSLFGGSPDETVEIKVVSGVNTVTFSKENLPAATEQYAQFWFYDQTGTVIYTGIEALTVVAGCVSSSEITLTGDAWHTYACAVSLKKDGAAWASSGKTVKLVNQTDSAKQYVLKDTSGGVFAASVSEGRYFVYVNDENTSVAFESVNKLIDVNYWTVKLGDGTKGVAFTPVNGAFDITETSALALGGSSFVYKMSLLPGYREKSTGSFVIKENGAAVEGAAFDSSLTISGINSVRTLTVSGLETITYSISYQTHEGAAITSSTSANVFWASGYTAPSSFTVEAPAELPGILDVKNKDGSKLDSWLDKDEITKAVKTTEGIYKNLTLVTDWKEFIGVDSGISTVYANGFNLLIMKETVDGEDITAIYADYDADGVVDAGVDEQVTDPVSGNKNFTGYHLTAGSLDENKVINSDFTFTMTGGTIASITGLDNRNSKRSNKSVLNISGESVIGSADTPKTFEGEGDVKVIKSKKVNGIMLETISNEWVNIVGAMSGDYQIYCVTPYSFDIDNEHTVAYIKNSNYADLKHFVCYTVDDEKDDGVQYAYTKDVLGMKRIMQNGVERTLIRLTDNSGIDLPKPDEVTGDVQVEFTLGEDRISEKCSVFSISVSKGSFRVNDRLTITENSTDEEKLVEDTLDYMCQPTPTTYETQLAYDKQYVYMHILSSGNQLTPEMASDFLRQVYFSRDDKDVPMTIKINLETVPSDNIAAAGVGYFNGSFYKKVEETPDHGDKDNDRIFWNNAYNKAKASKFNGLNGYLMNITSLVENNYIFKRLKIGAAWMGASRLVPFTNVWDEKIYPMDPDLKYDANYATNAFLTGSQIYRWQAGPEAGKPFFKVDSNMKGVQSSTWTKEDYLVYYDGEAAFQNWDNKYMATGVSGTEPNSSGTSGNMSTATNPDGTTYSIKDSREQCIQYKTDGTWNDLSLTSKTPTGYIIEYTPYDTYWDGSDAGDKAQTGSFPSITRTATY